MSMSDLFPSGPDDLPFRELILLVLAEAFVARRTVASFCADCSPDGRLCDEHARGLDLARQCENAYNRVAAGSPEWARLAVTLAGAMN